MDFTKNVGLEAKKTCASCGAIIDGEAHIVDGEAWCDECFNEAKACDDVYFCNRCEEWHEERWSNSTCIDGKTYCEDCFDDMLGFGEVFWCEYHETYEREESVAVHCGREIEYWCEYAVERHAWRCGDCGEWFSEDADSYYVRGMGSVCNACSCNYYYCDNCGDYVDADEWNDDEYLCVYCAEDKHKNELIHPYNYKPTPIFHGEGNWFIGCELEVDKGNNIYNACEGVLTALNGNTEEEEHAYIKHDGSLQDGFEIVTHPHTEETFFKLDWEGVFNACLSNGFVSHDARTCGLHLHISRRRFGATKYKQEIAISKMLAFYDVFYNEVVKVARRGTADALRWASPSTSAFDSNKEKIKKCRDIIKNDEYVGRYRAVNKSNLDTIEIRIMRGTLNKTTFDACVKFVLLIAKNSTKITFKNIMSVNEWLKGIDEETLNYVINRGAFLDFNGKVKKSKKEGA